MNHPHKATLPPETDPPQNADASPARLGELLDHRSHLITLRHQEQTQATEWTAELQTLENERLDLLAQLRVESDPDLRARAESLQEEVQALRQRLADAEAIAARLQGRIDAVDRALPEARRAYQSELGQYLDKLYVQYADRYQKAVPEVCEALLMIAAIHRVMMRHLTGNSNGWDRRVYLPQIVPFSGTTLTPHLDGGNQAFAEEAALRTAKVEALLREAGFIHPTR
ncbi:hypothetical protein [Methylocaldum sp.]|jgi:hypothetical protein|uniref:hypothetical protein n=1 Tax=Methylocaldum sp. TaxID=1969727 RepID=UPI00322017C1